jgi:hypothetical protein
VTHGYLQLDGTGSKQVRLSIAPNTQGLACVSATRQGSTVHYQDATFGLALSDSSFYQFVARRTRLLQFPHEPRADSDLATKSFFGPNLNGHMKIWRDNRHEGVSLNRPLEYVPFLTLVYAPKP